MIPNSIAGPAEGFFAGECLEPFKYGPRTRLWLTVREGRRFILKGLPESLRSHPEEIARLRKEYSLGLRLGHSGIVGIYGFETHPTVGQVIVMEYVDGVTLYDFVRKNKNIPLKTRVDIAHQIADALAYMHSLGISHRDLKPDNILVTRRNEAKIIDIGLGDSEDSVIYKQSVGTPGFGAPEQRTPGVGDSRSDVYSYGKILELLLPERKFRKLRACCHKENPAKRISIREADEMLTGVIKPRKRGFWWWVMVFYGVILALALVLGLIEELTENDRNQSMPTADTLTVDSVNKVEPLGLPETVDVSIVTGNDAAKTNAKSTELDTKPTESDSKSSESKSKLGELDILYEHAQMLDSAIAIYDIYYDRNRRVWKESKKERNQKAHEIADHLLKELEAYGCKPMETDYYLSMYWEYVVESNKRVDELMEHLKDLQEQAR